MAESQQIQGSRASGSARAESAKEQPEHDNHGQSVASWTAVGVVMIGALTMAIAVVIASLWLFIVGAVIAVLGGISGKVLAAMGFGKSGRPGH